MFNATVIPPEMLEISDHCELGLCPHNAYALVITEKDSFFVCSQCLRGMNQISSMLNFLEN